MGSGLKGILCGTLLFGTFQLIGKLSPGCILCGTKEELCAVRMLCDVLKLCAVLVLCAVLGLCAVQELGVGVSRILCVTSLDC